MGNEWQASIPNGTDTSDQAEGVKDFGGSAGWTGRLYTRTVLRLQQAQTFGQNIAIFHLRDTADHLIVELYLAPDRTLHVWSPAGGLQTNPTNLNTGYAVPFDGTSTARIELSALWTDTANNNSLLLRINGGTATTLLSNFSGGSSLPGRYLRAGIDHYDALTIPDPVTLFQSSVGVTSLDWLGTRGINVPTNTGLPAISGTPQQGQTLTTTNGTWNGSPTSYSYQWKRCDTTGGNCTSISTATNQTYTLTATDVGNTIRAAVTATNNDGDSAPATSNQTTTITTSSSDPTVITDFTPVTDGGCTGCSFTSVAGEWKATIQGGADTVDSAYGLKDFGGSAGWSGTTYTKTVLRLPPGQALGQNIAFFHLRDTLDHLIYELYLAPDRTLHVWSPAGGLRGVDTNEATTYVVPNNGTATATIEVSLVPGDSLILRVNGSERLRIPGLSGATTTAARYIRSGIDHYDTATTNEPISIYQSKVGISQSDWIGGSIATGQTTTTYVYDSAGRLTCATTLPAGTSLIYSYDKDSNRQQVKQSAAGCSGAATVSATYTYDPNVTAGVDELTSTSQNGGTTSYTYTPDGQVAARGSDTITWNTQGRTSGGTFNGTSLAYTYDPTGALKTRTTTSPAKATNYLLGDLYEIGASGTITASYIDGPAGAFARYNGAPTTAPPTYFYYSGHGDLAAEADQSGTLTAAYTYDAFGGPLESLPANSTAHRFTGRWDKQDDATSNLILMGARPYDPTLGRFLAVDPIEGGSLNNYDYAGQDPINGFDLGGDMSSTVMRDDGGPESPAAPTPSPYGRGTSVEQGAATVCARLPGSAECSLAIRCLLDRATCIQQFSAAAPVVAHATTTVGRVTRVHHSPDSFNTTICGPASNAASVPFFSKIAKVGRLLGSLASDVIGALYCADPAS